MGVDEPVAILWSDHLIKDNPEFQKALKVGEKLIIENPNRFVFTGEIPRFANNNIGWINIGGVVKNVDGLDVYNFEGWTYRPAIESVSYTHLKFDKYSKSKISASLLDKSDPPSLMTTVDSIE